MSFPYFSIIIPCYNVEPYVEESIKSVSEQTFDDWEAIIVNDGSTDNTEKIISEFAKKDKRIKYFSKCNEGIGSTRNFAIKKACGKYIAFLDADDLWMPDYLESQNEFLKGINHNYYFIYTNAFIILENKKTSLKYYPNVINFQPTLNKSVSLKDLIRRNIIFSMIIFPRQMFFDAGGFDSDLRAGEDYDFWLRAIYKGYKAVFNPMIKAYYRIRKNSLSNDREKLLEAHSIIYNKLLISSNLSSVERRAVSKALCKNKREILISIIKRKIKRQESIQDEINELFKLRCDSKIFFLRTINRLNPLWAERIIKYYFRKRA